MVQREEETIKEAKKSVHFKAKKKSRKTSDSKEKPTLLTDKVRAELKLNGAKESSSVDLKSLPALILVKEDGHLETLTLDKEGEKDTNEMVDQWLQEIL